MTLTGPGGTGKTRLALQAAADALEAYPDGVWLVELAALADPALVPQAVAAAVGVREEPGRPAAGHAGRRAARPGACCWCWTTASTCSTPAPGWPTPCCGPAPHLRVLATSREALGIAGETAWRVPSLALPRTPRRQRPPPPEALTRYEAVRLFVERAAAVQPGVRA